jgi:hypothetical protein
MVSALLRMVAAMERYIIANKVIREFKHRAPALMGYVEAIVQQEAVLAQELPPTLPPASTMARGQTPHAVNMHYPEMPERCPHLVEHGRRYGNARGKFLECVNCGSVWKGLDYVVPITNELVTTYKTFLGLRDRPGGRVMKGVQTRRTSSTKSSAYSSSSPPTSMEAAYGRTAPTSTTSTRRIQPKTKVKAEPREESPPWVEVDTIMSSGEEEASRLRTS